MPDQFTIKRPWNLDADIAALPTEKPVGLPVISAPEQLGVQDNSISPELAVSIFRNNAKRADVKDPFESKFQDSDLSKRYEGRSVGYGDWKLDPKTLDARYSKTQSWAEQSYNSLKIGLANMGATYALGMLGMPDILNNIKSGVSGEENQDSDLTNNLYDWSRGVANKNINFENEQDQKTDAWNVIKNALLPSFASGSSGGYGKLFESVGYGLGAGAAVATQELALSYASAGIGTIPGLSLGVVKAINNIDKLRKYSKLADRIIDTSEAILSVGKGLNNVNKIKNAGRWAYATTIAAHGEAAFEGIDGKRAFIEEQSALYQQKNGVPPSGKDLENIEKLGHEVETSRYWVNMGLLMASGSIQLGRLFRNIDIAKEGIEKLANAGLKVELDAAGKPIAKKAFELNSSWWNKGFQSKLKPFVEPVAAKLNSELLKEGFSEGVEEFTQGWVDKSVNSYYTWKLDHRGQSSIDQAMKSIGEGFSDSFTTEGLESFLSGAVAGIAQQSAFAGVNVKKQLALNKATKEALEKTLEEYEGFDIDGFVRAFNVNSIRGTVVERAENLNASGVADDIANTAAASGDKKVYKDMESLSFFLKAEPYVKRGHADILKDQFKFSLENLSDEEINNLFDGQITKDQAVKEFNTKVDSVNESYSRVKSNFKNPYRANGSPEERYKYAMFEDKFLGELAFMDHRMKDLNKRKSDIQNELGAYYDDLKYFADISTLDKGRDYLLEQIDAIKTESDYFKKLGTENVSIDESFNKDKYLVDTYTEALKKLDTFNKSKTEEDYKDFLSIYHQAFISKNEMNEVGFFNEDEVMNKLTDHNRIVDDLDATQKMLRSYLSPKGDELFTRGYEALLKQEQRKRVEFSLSNQFKGLKGELLTKHPELTSEDIDGLLSESGSVEEATKLAEELEKTKAEDELKIEDTKTKLREKFTSQGKGDIIEGYINTIKITPLNQDKVLEQADEYIKNLSNKEFSDFKNTQYKNFLRYIKTLDKSFTGFISEENNKAVYDGLTTSDKIKYHEAVIKYYNDVLEYKDLPDSFIKETKDKIKSQEEIIKELKALPVEVNYTESYAGFDIVQESVNKFNVSLNNKHVDTFRNLKEAKQYIENELNKIEEKNDTSTDGINNLQNKFENGWYNPVYFDENGKIIENSVEINQTIQLRADLYNKIATNKTPQQVNEDITTHIVIDTYSIKNSNIAGDIIINSPDELVHNGQLPQERILKSETVDAIMLSYLDEEGNKIPLNTYKNYKTGLGFVNKDLLKTELSEIIKDENVVDAIINFIGDSNYYEFLVKSLDNPEVYNELVKNGFLKFKGDIQQQIDLINDKQKIYDFIANNSLDDIKKKLIFEREFTSINYEDVADHNINEILYPHALLKLGEDSYNQYSFFRIADEFNSGDIENTPISFIGLPQAFQQSAKEKIIHSFSKRYKNNTKIFNGYFMLVTDSSGNPAVYSLTNKLASDEEFLQAVLDDKKFKNVTILSTNNNLNFNYSEDKGRINISDKTDDSKLYIQHEIKDLKSVKNLKTVILSTLAKENNWFKEDGSSFKKVYDTSDLGLRLSQKGEQQPTTIQDVINTRMVTGINTINYKVTKIVPYWRDEDNSGDVPIIENNNIITPEEVKVPLIVNTSGETKTLNMMNSLGITLPDYVNTQEIDIFVDRINNTKSTKDQLIKAIVVAFNKNKSNKDIFLNETMNLGLLDEIASFDDVDLLDGTFGDAPTMKELNLFSNRNPYKTTPNLSEIEQRVEKLIKNCIR